MDILSQNWLVLPPLWVATELGWSPLLVSTSGSRCRACKCHRQHHQHLHTEPCTKIHLARRLLRKWNWRWGTMELEWRQCLGIWKLEKWRTKQCWRPPRLFRHLGREMEWLALRWTLGFTNSYTWFPLSKERSVAHRYLTQITYQFVAVGWCRWGTLEKILLSAKQ